MCAFLDRNRDSFRTCGFQGLTPKAVPSQPAPLKVTPWKTGIRMFEQAYRRKYQ
ncbi:hypothetical protein NOC27_3073 [Nitrosococcus oceani AFC27]|nr:hypothetical protein NOC27_3073 [Nitrosococcus oceani AFC27]